MNEQKKPVYIEFNMARDGFCLVEDVISADPKLVKGKLASHQEAKDWAAANGYVLNEYVDGVLQPKI